MFNPSISLETRQFFSKSINIIQQFQTLIDGDFIVYSVEQVQVYDDCVDMDASVRVFCGKHLMAGEGELISQVRRLSVLDHKGTHWQFGKDNKPPHFPAWKDQKKIALTSDKKYHAEISLDRKWELRSFSSRFFPGNICKGRAVVFHYTYASCHVLVDGNDPVSYSFIAITFGLSMVTYEKGNSPRKVALVFQEK